VLAVLLTDVLKPRQPPFVQVGPVPKLQRKAFVGSSPTMETDTLVPIVQGFGKAVGLVDVVGDKLTAEVLGIHRVFELVLVLWFQKAKGEEF
jgi:hypothetical protein